MNFEELKDRTQIGIQTVAVLILGWLSTEISVLNNEMKQLNEQMVKVVTMTSAHDKDLNLLKNKIYEIDKDYVGREEFDRKLHLK